LFEYFAALVIIIVDRDAAPLFSRFFSFRGLILFAGHRVASGDGVKKLYNNNFYSLLYSYCSYFSIFGDLFAACEHASS
jgi:hypothetical protein